MAKQTINIGVSANDGNGDPLRVAFDKINDNFDELYTIAGAGDLDDLIAPLFTHSNHTNVTVTQDDVNNQLILTVNQVDPGDLTGSVFGHDSTVLVDATNSSINLDGTVKGNIIPDTDVAYDLGSATNRFRDIYLSGSTIDLGGTTLSVVGGVLQIGGTDINDVVTAAGINSLTAGSNIPTLETAYDNARAVLDALLDADDYGAELASPSDYTYYELAVRKKALNPLIPDEVVSEALNVLNAYNAWQDEIEAETATITVGDREWKFKGDGTVDGLYVNGDITGSVFGDDSTLLVDGVAGKIVGDVYTNYIETGVLRSHADQFLEIVGKESATSSGSDIRITGGTSTDTENFGFGGSVVIQAGENPNAIQQDGEILIGTDHTNGVAIGAYDFGNGFGTIVNISGVRNYIGEPGGRSVTYLRGTIDFSDATVSELNVDLTGNFQGSVFADDSTLLVDGVAGKIVGDVENSIVYTDVVYARNSDLYVNADDQASLYLGATNSQTIVIGASDSTIYLNGNQDSLVGAGKFFSPRGTDLNIATLDMTTGGADAIIIKGGDTSDSDNSAFGGSVKINAGKNSNALQQHGDIQIGTEFTNGVAIGTYDGGDGFGNTVSLAGYIVNVGNSNNLSNIQLRGNVDFSDAKVSNLDVELSGDLTGSVFSDDSTLLVDGVNSKINLQNTVLNNTISTINDEALYLNTATIPGDRGGRITTTDNIFDIYGATLEDGNGGGVWLSGGLAEPGKQQGDVIISGRIVSILAGDGEGGGGIALSQIIGRIDGDIQGSVFADDSTTLVDGVNGKIVGDIQNNLIETNNVIGKNSQYLYIISAYDGGSATNIAFNYDTDINNVRQIIYGKTEFGNNGAAPIVDFTGATVTGLPHVVIANEVSGSATLAVGSVMSVDYLNVRLIDKGTTLGVEFNYDPADFTSVITAFSDDTSVGNVFNGSSSVTVGNTTWTEVTTLGTIGDRITFTLTDHSSHKVYRATVTMRGAPVGIDIGDAYAIIETLK